MFTTYILYSHTLDKYYIGSTSDLEGRLQRHHAANHGFTSVGKPWILVYSECYNTKTEALKRENQLKAWKNKNRLKALINKPEYPESSITSG